MYMLLDGPEHIRGNAHPQGFFTSVRRPVQHRATEQNQRFTLGMGPAGARLTAVTVGTQVVPDGAESGAYLGFLLLDILIVGTILLWRRPLMRWAAGLAVVSFVFSMGSRLRVDGHVTPLHLPFVVTRPRPADQEARSRPVSPCSSGFSWPYVRSDPDLPAPIPSRVGGGRPGGAACPPPPAWPWSRLLWSP